MKPYDVYKNNSKLPTAVQEVNQNNLLKIFQQMEVALNMENYDKLRNIISTLFDYIDIENHAQINDPILTLVDILFYIYNYCDKHDKNKLIKLIKTLQETVG